MSAWMRLGLDVKPLVVIVAFDSKPQRREAARGGYPPACSRALRCCCVGSSDWFDLSLCQGRDGCCESYISIKRKMGWPSVLYLLLFHYIQASIVRSAGCFLAWYAYIENHVHDSSFKCFEKQQAGVHNMKKALSCVKEVCERHGVTKLFRTPLSGC